MTHDLSDDAAGHFYPLGKASKSSAQAVEGHMLKAGDGQRAIVGDARLSYPAFSRSRAAEYPFIFLGLRGFVWVKQAV
jgi:hypothetical protein